jgi:hypothetical protein
VRDDRPSVFTVLADAVAFRPTNANIAGYRSFRLVRAAYAPFASPVGAYAAGRPVNIVAKKRRSGSDHTHKLVANLATARLFARF